jgi:hypothetical protein
MKLWIAGIALCLSVAARADLMITEVMSSSSHTNTVANGDWWELYNSGASDIDLTGYSWDDNTATAGSADFNSVTILAGSFLIVCQETVGAEQAWRDVWGIAASVPVVNLGGNEFQNFSSAGDEIHLYSPALVELASVIFGAATSGQSFEWDSAGNSLGLSVAGENGAFQATLSGGGGPDIASPGTGQSIPEPATLLLFGLGSLVLTAGRKKSNR